MQTYDAMQRRRSVRKFHPEPVSGDCLEKIVEVSRLYPSGGNLQPVRFAIVTKPALTDALFANLKWAMYLPDFTIPPCERPTAYIVLLRDTLVSKKCDYDIGAASTMVMLAAADQGLGSCPIGNFPAAKLSALLQLPDTLHPELVIALGHPAHESRVVPMTDSIRYTQDEGGDFSVPKHSTDEVLVFTDTQEEL